MIRTKTVWDLYLEGNIQELPVSTIIDTGVSSSDKGKELADIKNTVSSFNPSILEKIINSYEQKDIPETYSHLEILEQAELSSEKVETYGLRYLYGHVVRVIKTGNVLDLYIDAKTNSIAEKFQESYKSLQLSHTITAIGNHQQSCKSYSESLASLEDLAHRRGIEINMSSIVSKQLHQFRAWDIECDSIQCKIDEKIEEYRSLEPVEKNIKIIKKLRRPVSKRFGLFKGHILKTCSKLDYIVGLEQCENLSEELNYVKDNLDEIYREKQDIISKLDTIRSVSDDIKSYSVPVSSMQLWKLLRLMDKKVNSTGRIYFKKTEDELETMLIQNREVVHSIISRQKSYLLGVQDTLTKILVKTVPDFKEVESIINSIDSRTLELKEYLPQMDLLDLSMTNTNNILTTSDALLKKLIESKGAYDQLGKNIQSLEQLERDMKKNNLSEARLNTLSVIIQDAKTIPEIPIATLKKPFEYEHKEYQNKIELFIDSVIDKIDELSSNTPASSSGALDVLKYYEKVQTFRDIGQKVKDYRNQLINTQGSKPKGSKPVYEFLVSEPKPVEKVPINPNSIVSLLKTVELPKDTRYWVINDILMGKMNEDGWIRSMELLCEELGELRKENDLAKTDYVLNIANIVDASYKNGQLKRLASIHKDNKKIIESTVNELYSFGKIVSS